MLFHTEAIFIKSHAIYYGFGVLGILIDKIVMKNLKNFKV